MSAGKSYGPDSERPGDPDRRSGKDRRQADRRDLDVPVEKDRRSPGWDRRRGDRRQD